jgi:predicted DNA-binding transcriptional regulator YafY
VGSGTLSLVRASRLLSVLLLLQARGRLTAQQLADELGVSVRTIYRDVESLHAAGVPLYGDAGPAGGYQLVAGYRTRLTGLTAGEAEALFLAGLPGPAAELGLGAVVAATQLKLMAALPAELRDRAGRIQERFHLDAPSWYRGYDDAPHLAAVADAVWNQRRIQVRYRRWAEPVEVTRTLAPYGLVVKAGRWYLVARSEPPTPHVEAEALTAQTPAGRGGVDRIRTYRVAEILELHPLDEQFERPGDFDLAGHWRAYVAEFDARRYRSKAVLRLSPRAWERLPHLLDPAVVRAAERSAGEPDAAGWTEVVIPIESVAHAATELLRLGADVEALAPPELRASLAETADGIATLYRSSSVRIGTTR